MTLKSSFEILGLDDTRNVSRMLKSYYIIPQFPQVKFFGKDKDLLSPYRKATFNHLTAGVLDTVWYACGS